MFNKWLWAIILVLLLSFNNHSAYADEIESGFKGVSTQIAKEWERLQDKANNSAAIEKYSISFENHIPGWGNALRELINQEPKSIWADDAQYIIAAVFSATNLKKQALEYEYLLKNYPDMHIEDWTQETLKDLLRKFKDVSYEQMARIDLCMLYKTFGEKEKLNKLCEESIKKYPDKAKYFEKILQPKITAPN
ncbi:MAG: hypothetical protein PHW54_05705 [Candidatus Omnitrophica bacterium]|nr:hypothetical protein [Candidatus Omnitrophota bacterium]